MWCGTLKQSCQLPSLLLGEREWWSKALDGVFIQIHQHEVVVRQIRLVSLLNTDNIRNWRLESLNKAVRQHWHKNASPLERIQQRQQCVTGQMQHRCVRRDENYACLRKHVLKQNDNIRDRHCPEQRVQICISRARQLIECFLASIKTQLPNLNLDLRQ
jgi:hypothetical protein